MRLGSAAAATVATIAMLAASVPAHADIPDGWVPGPDGIEYDFGFTSWTHHGWYANTKGNWHTGYLTIEEDDDGIQGELQDWFCKGKAQPPLPGSTTAPDRRCKLKNSIWLDTIDQPVGLEMSSFDQAENSLSVDLVIDGFDTYLGEYVRSVPVDIVIRAKGAPDEASASGSGDSLYYYESYDDTRTRGTVDGHGVGTSKKTTSYSGRISFTLSEWDLAT